MKKLCIFDLDGTLSDTLTAISHFGNLALKEAMDMPPVEKEKYKYFVGDGRDVLIHRMLDYYNLDNDEKFAKTCKVYDRYYEADPMYKTDAYDGIKELLAKLRKNGTKIAVCTNKPANVAHDVVHTIFGDIFDFISGITDDVKTKPSPDTALKIIETLNISKADSVFIGDTNIDINTAKNAGIESIGVLWGFRDEKELTDAGADHIVSSPHEIFEIVTGK